MYRISLRVTVAALFLAGSCVFAGPGDDGENPAPDEVAPEFGPIGQATLTANSECVVASELMGSWELDWKLTRRMWGKDPLFGCQELSFSENEAASNRMLTELVLWYNALLADKGTAESAPRLARAMQTVYLAGSVKKRNSDELDFALTVLNGNPYLIVRQDGHFKYECSSIMLARDAEGDNDLLFIGAPANDQTFLAYKRKIKVNKEE